MQKHFKKLRLILALVFFAAFLISFADFRGNMPSRWHSAILYLQFIPSVIKFLTPLAVLSVGFIVVLLITLLAGRIYCSTICPLGVLQDFFIRLRKKWMPKKGFRFKPPHQLLRYSILVLGLLSLLFTGVLVFNLLDPYALFGRMAAHLYQPSLGWANNIVARLIPASSLHTINISPLHLASFAFAGGSMTLLLYLSMAYERLYCNSICPVGTFLGLLSKVSLFKLKINATSCTHCGKCQTVCKSNCISVKDMHIDESRCVNCFNCITVCSENSIAYKKTTLSLAKKPVTANDSGRRLFLATISAFLAAKALPVFAAQEKKSKEEHEDKICFFSRGPIAPPGAIGIEHLKSRCVACHLCVAVCPTKVLQPSFLEYGFTGMNLPKMDFGVNYCNYECRKCGEVCPTGAIVMLEKEQKKLTQIGHVVLRMNKCIVETEATACGSCSEHCPTQAVKMVPYYNGLPAPEIDPSICIGCGACEYACPVTDPHPAIFVAPNTLHVLAEKPIHEALETVIEEEFPF